MPTKNILIIGAGPVSGPAVAYLSRNSANTLTLACRTLSKAQTLASRYPNCKPLGLDASDPALLRAAISAHDIVVSLIPPTLHPGIAETCISLKIHFVCTSSTRPELASLAATARDAGVALVTECGVAPGLDHVYAVDKITKIHEGGGRVEGFESFVGGLAEPGSCENPLRTKFSWNPKNTLLSQLYPAVFLRGGAAVNIAGEDLMDTVQPVETDDSSHEFVGFPSGSCLGFREHYDIAEARDLIRGTLRYKQNPLMVSTLHKLGWLVTDRVIEAGTSWAGATRLLSGVADAALIDHIKALPHIARLTSSDVESLIKGIHWIGLLSPEAATTTPQPAIDVLCARLEVLCSWEREDRDMVILQHRFRAVYPDGRREKSTLTLELFGEAAGGDTAMARSTGTMCGIMVQMLLDGHTDVARPGLVRPYAPEACRVMKEKLEAEGLAMVERVSAL